jgi:hypothetical protein
MALRLRALLTGGASMSKSIGITLNAVAGGPRTTTLDGDRTAMAYDQTSHLIEWSMMEL